ncbi:MAG TPA: hypothetical protein VKH37_03685 [Ferruginibacter sp.]|nr:hypothetical protein [Ferruginibacter sp.]
MALEEFEKEQISDRDKGYIRMRSIMDLGMGTLWMALGLFLIFVKKLNANFAKNLAERFDETMLYVFGGICIVYGLFRIWRGYKKNYLRDR